MPRKWWVPSSRLSSKLFLLLWTGRPTKTKTSISWHFLFLSAWGRFTCPLRTPLITHPLRSFQTKFGGFLPPSDPPPLHTFKNSGHSLFCYFSGLCAAALPFWLLSATERKTARVPTAAKYWKEYWKNTVPIKKLANKQKQKTTVVIRGELSVYCYIYTEVHVDCAAPEVCPVEQATAAAPPDEQGPQPRGVAQHLVEGEHQEVWLNLPQVCTTQPLRSDGAVGIIASQ